MTRYRPSKNRKIVSLVLKHWAERKRSSARTCRHFGFQPAVTRTRSQRCVCVCLVSEPRVAAAVVAAAGRDLVRRRRRPRLGGSTPSGSVAAGRSGRGNDRLHPTGSAQTGLRKNTTTERLKNVL